jgi:hypothetical protein
MTKSIGGSDTVKLSQMNTMDRAFSNHYPKIKTETLAQTTPPHTKIMFFFEIIKK